MSKIFFSLLCLCLALTACSAPTLTACSAPTQPLEPGSTPTRLPTRTPTLLPTATQTPAPTSAASRTPAPTRTRLPTKTGYRTPATAWAPLSLSQPPVAFIGESPTGSGEIIGRENYSRLANTAIWGKGVIVDIAFAPDGRSFAVGSPLGVGIYDRARPSEPPRWLPFPHLLRYLNLAYDERGEYLLLDGSFTGPLQAALRLADGQIIDPAPALAWLQDANPEESDREIQETSPDGKIRYSGSRTYEQYYDEDYEEWYTTDTEIAVSKMLAAASGDVLYTLKDEPPRLRYYQHWIPQGCDLRFFSWCGNAYADLGSVPVKAQFSADSKLFAVAYQPDWASEFRTLRLYRAADGALLATFGSFDHPVQDFTFAPDNSVLLVAYQDGSIHLVDLANRKVAFTAQHFNGPLYHVELSSDGQFLLLYHPETIEVRSTRAGAKLWSAPAVRFAASPTANIVAVGADDGTLQLRRLDNGHILHELEGHSAAIYALAFSPDGRSLVSSSDDCTVRLWDVRTGIFQHYFAETWLEYAGETERSSRIFLHYLEILPEQQIVVGYGSWGTMVSWDFNSGKRLYKAESPPLEFYNGMVTLDAHYSESFWVDPTAGRFYIEGVSYDLSNGEVIGPLQARTLPEQDCASSGPVTPDGRLVFTRGFGELEGRICILHGDTRQFLDSVQVAPKPGDRHGQSLTWPMLSHDGRQLFVPTFEGAIYVYQIVR